MMAKSVFESQLQEFLAKKPFQPFVIELDDGDSFLIGSRQAISYLAGDSAMYFGEDESIHFVDADNVKRIIAASPAGKP